MRYVWKIYVETEVAMGRVSGGAWWKDVRRVVRLIGHTVTVPQLTTALMEDRSTLSLAMARRLASAYTYSASKTDDDVLASIAVCEQLQAIDRLDPTANAPFIGPALMGEVPLSALQALAASTRARLSAISADTMTPAALVDLCPEWKEAGLREQDIEFDQIRDSDDVLVDAAAYIIVPTELADRWEVEYYGRWCMLVSPHIQCAKTSDPSHEKFVARIRIALSLYERVSVICSSSYEHGMVEKRLRKSPVWHRVWLRHLDDSARRQR